MDSCADKPDRCRILSRSMISAAAAAALVVVVVVVMVILSRTAVS